MGDKMVHEPVWTAEKFDPVRYIAVQLTEPQAAGVAAELVADLTAKVNAGARLFYALAHHPKAEEFFLSEFMSIGLTKAYNDAALAFLNDHRRGS